MTLPTPPAPADPDARVVYLTRPGCHLCEEALPTVRAEADRAGTVVDVRNIDEEPRLREDWNDHVPVIVVDGTVVATYRITAEQMRAALAPHGLGARLKRWFGG